MNKYILFLLALIICSSLVYSQVPNSPILIEPPKEANIVTLTPTLSWNAVSGADCYFIYITTDTNISAPLETCMTNDPSYQVPSNQLTAGHTYFWYVQAHNNFGWGERSPYFYFSISLEAPTVTESIHLLEGNVNSIVEGGRLNPVQGNILNNRLDQALHHIELGHSFPALIQMAIFKFRVFLLQISGLLPENDAMILNEGADGVIDLIQDLSKPQRIPDIAPHDFKLMQNYPNPFNPSTTIEYTIPENSVVTLKIYDILGKEVASLVNKYQNQGSYIVMWNAANLSSGLYIYKLTAGSYSDTKKMVLSK